MNFILPPLEPAAARRLLAQVPWSQRLTVGRLRPPVGLLPGEVRSLGDLEMFLAPDEAWLPGVDPVALCRWVEDVLGDAPLAEALHAGFAVAPNYVEGCVRAYFLVQDRVARARAAADTEVGPAGEAIA